MIVRCYSSKYHSRSTYKDCYVQDEWKTFSNFRKWMEAQEWEGLHLEKDLLICGNKVYSPDTCVFVTQQVNGFLIDSVEFRGEWPIGVNWHKNVGKFIAQCNNPFTKKSEHLGVFDCPYEAHAAWLAKKLEHAYALAAIQTDPRVAAALIERYTNYQSDRIKEEL